MAEQNLNAQQVAAVDQQVKVHLANVIDKMTLRKWAVEQALAKTNPSVEIIDPVKFATSIYNFVVAPALEPFKPD